MEDYNHEQKVIIILKDMQGIGGVPTNQEFYNEFNDRLLLKLGLPIPLPSTKPVSVTDELRDKFFKDLVRIDSDKQPEFNCMPHNVFEWMRKQLTEGKGEEEKYCNCESPTGRTVDENYNRICDTCGNPTTRISPKAD